MDKIDKILIVMLICLIPVSFIGILVFSLLGLNPATIGIPALIFALVLFMAGEIRNLL
jgi:hypothetical protein